MATPWDEARVWVRGVQDQSRSWASDRRHLLRIIDAAEKWGLAEAFWKLPGRSNLRAIVPAARRATERATLERILDWACTLSNEELRIRLATVEREKIEITRFERGGKEEGYLLRLTPEQYNRIEKSTRAKYVFVVGK